jgi:hypothetical protein
VWTHFILELKSQFQDTQAKEHTRLEIEGMHMKWPDIDQYIVNFKQVARRAEYPLTAPTTLQYFMKGLTKSVANNMLKPPKVHTYREVKQQAVNSVASQLLIHEMFKQDQVGQAQPPSTRWNRFNQPQNSQQQQQ